MFVRNYPAACMSLGFNISCGTVVLTRWALHKKVSSRSEGS
jgi:hypothetical protein